jgi:hypothetical protein
MGGWVVFLAEFEVEARNGMRPLFFYLRRASKEQVYL